MPTTTLKDKPNRSGAGHCSSQLDDASLQAALQPWIPMECFQLSQGRQLSRLESLDLGSQQIVQETQTAAIQKLGAMPSNLSTLSFCTPDPAFRFSEHSSGNDDTIFFMAGGSEFDLRVPAGVRTTYVSFNQDDFLRDARIMDPRKWAREPVGVRALNARRKDQFEAAVRLWFTAAGEAAEGDRAPDGAIMRRLLLQLVLDIAIAATEAETEHVPHRARTRTLQICREAKAFVEHRFDAGDLPGVADICVAAGVCERTLQYAFRDYVRMSPTAYLRLLRLNRVREHLTIADPQETTVTDVAMRFGFLHLGRFGQDYKRVFGETPSATLAA